MKEFSLLKGKSATVYSAIFICIVVSIAIISAKKMGWFQQWDLIAYDILLNQTKVKNELNKEVIIVGISEKDIQTRQEWPLSDISLVQLIQSIQNHSPSAIGIDIYRDMFVPPGSDALAKILQNNPNIFLVEKFSANGSETSIRPNKALVNEQQTGFSDILIDSDGVVRRGLLFLNNDNRIGYALSLRLAAAHLASKQIQPGSSPDSPQHIMFGSVTYIPLESNDGGYVNLDAGGYQYFLSFSSGLPGFRVIDMNELLTSDGNLDFINGKVVIVGVISESVKDSFLTPLNKNRGGGLISGAVLHAHATSQLIDSALMGSKPLMTLSENLENIWILLWATVGLICAIISTSIARYIVLFSLSLLALGIITQYLFALGYWLPVVSPLSAFLDVFLLISGYVYIQERRQRNMVMDLFSRHVSSDVANEVWAQRDDFFNGGRLRSQQATATILFTDLVGYTTTAENLDPEALMVWLNDYMEVMANCVIRHGGMIDDYYGDAIKANFGVPMINDSELSIKQNVHSAIECALEMNQQIISMNKSRLEKKLLPIGMRIGIATGVVVVGSLGSRQRLKYTSIGDVVNIAARLESYAREAPAAGNAAYCSILMAESTRAYLDNNYETRLIGELHLKGKNVGLKAYQLLT